MKILQIFPNWSVFHSDQAKGMKAVARDISLCLQARGHSVSIYLPDGSIFPGVQVIYGGPSLKDRGWSIFDKEALELQTEYAERVLPQLDEYDILHSHIEHILLPFIPRLNKPVISTVHGGSFTQREEMVFRLHPHGVFVALSQRAIHDLSYIKFSSIIYNGIDPALYFFTNAPVHSTYLAWMGRFSHVKGAKDAIAVAKQVRKTLVLAGFPASKEEEYFESLMQMVDGAQIQLINRHLGESKSQFLGDAKLFLFPILWEEPFGLVMIEAMACGTPVVAYARGSVPEVVIDGVTGFVVNSSDQDVRGDWVVKKTGIEGLKEAVERIYAMPEEEYRKMRVACRKHVEDHFTVEKMVEGYEAVYEKILASSG